MNLNPQLYMWSGKRDQILERHDFYIAQTRKRVLANFTDIDGDAENFMRAEYDRLGAKFDHYPADVAEWVNERGQGYWALLHDLRKQTLLGALAGFFHQWDKELRDFLEGELSHNFEPKDVRQVAWSQNVKDIYDVLTEFGWDCRAGEFFTRLEACRLIVNVYKHGKGASLDQLAASFPEYRPHPFGPASASAFSGAPDHEWLEISEAQFDDLAKAIRSFWEVFPERLFLK